MVSSIFKQAVREATGTAWEDWIVNSLSGRSILYGPTNR